MPTTAPATIARCATCGRTSGQHMAVNEDHEFQATDDGAASMPTPIPANASVRTRQVKACLAAAGIDASAATVRSHDAVGARCVWVMNTDLDAAEHALTGLWEGLTIRRHDSFLALVVPTGA